MSLTLAYTRDGTGRNFSGFVLTQAWVVWVSAFGLQDFGPNHGYSISKGYETSHIFFLLSFSLTVSLEAAIEKC